MSYSKLSYSLTKKITKKEKKENGIYFTPPSTIQKNIDLLKIYMPTVNSILEPSCGSGEYVNYLNNHYKNKELTAIEYNKQIYDDTLKVNFLKRIRDEKKFLDLSKLKLQLKKDENECRTLINKFY